MLGATACAFADIALGLHLEPPTLQGFNFTGGLNVSNSLVALWMGIYPKPFLEPLKAPVGSLMARLERAAPPQTPHTPIVATAPVQMASATVGDAK